MSCRKHKVQRLFEDIVRMFSLYMTLECVCGTECLAAHTAGSVYERLGLGLVVGPVVPHVLQLVHVDAATLDTHNVLLFAEGLGQRELCPCGFTT